MAITRETNGGLRTFDVQEEPPVVLLHQKVRDSHNSGRQGLFVHRLWEEIRDVFPHPDLRKVIVDELAALVDAGLLERDLEDDQRFLHTSTDAFRLERASTDYRSAISDICSRAEQQGSEMHELLKHTDSAMRAVKIVGRQPDWSARLLRKLKA